MKYRILISGVLLLSMLTSCAQTAQTVSTDGTAASAATSAQAAETTYTRETYPDGLPAADWKGRQFRASVTDMYEYEIGVKEENGEVTNDAIWRRNNLLEDKYNVKIVTKPVMMAATNNQDMHVEYIKKTVLAGSDEFDLAMLYVWKAADPVLSGQFVDFSDVAYVDFTKPWWNARANAAFTVAGSNYTPVSDLSLTAMQLAYCYLYNKQIAENYKVGKLYDTVQSGEWTIDRLIDYAKKVNADLDGNSVMDTKDLYAVIVDKVTGLDCYREAFDISTTSRDADGYPTLVLNTPRTVEAVEKLNTLYYDCAGSWVTQYWDKYTFFMNSQALFIPARVITLYDQLRGMDVDYGILPFPKFNEEQEEYLTGVVDNYSVLCVPVTAKDTDFCGFMTEALNAETYRSVVYQYYDVALQTKYTRDESSIETLDMIMAGRSYDLATMLGSSMGGAKTILRKIVSERLGGFASYYASQESLLNEKLAEIKEAYKKLEKK